MFSLWGGSFFLPLFCFGENESETEVSVTPNSPSGLSATAESAYKVSLSWDSVPGAGGYNVYRGGELLGFTSSSSYSDTGLTPETTYSYTVSTVGGSGVESEQSDPVSVTTLEEEEEGGGGGFIFPEKPEANFVSINEEAYYTREKKVTLSLSAEGAYQMAVSNELNFEGVSWEKYSSNKEWVLSSGEGEKNVYVKFRSEQGGVSRVVQDSIILDMTPPPNVKSLESFLKEKAIEIKWKNPESSDFAGVKVMRSTDFFPIFPWEGEEVFKGDASFFIDKDVTSGTTYYYTVFSYDEAGNYSSGATTYKLFDSFVEEPPPDDVGPPPDDVEPPPPPPQKIKEIELNDFVFEQSGEKILLENGEISVLNDEVMSVSIDYDKLPENLKTIMVTLEKDQKSFSFLLRVNDFKTIYTGEIFSPEEPGVYNLTIRVYNYKTQEIKKIEGTLEVLGEKQSQPYSPTFLTLLKNSYTCFLFLLFFFIILLFLLKNKKKANS